MNRRTFFTALAGSAVIGSLPAQAGTPIVVGYQCKHSVIKHVFFNEATVQLVSCEENPECPKHKRVDE